MNILITGVSGKIGKEVFKFFIKKNFFIYGVYNKKPSKLKKKNNFKLIKRNLKNKNTDLPKEINAIIHVAFKTHNVNSKKEYLENIKITKNLINIIKKNKRIKKLIFLSAMAIYNNKNLGLVNEKVKILNSNYYAKAKYYSEKKFNKLKIKVYNLRIPGVLCTKNEVNFFAHMVSKIKQNKDISLYNKRNWFNNIILMSNLNNFILNLLKNNYKSGTTVLGSSQPVYLGRIVELIKKRLKSRSKIRYRYKKEGFYINISHAKSKFKFKPLTTIKTIQKYLRYKNYEK